MIDIFERLHRINDKIAEKQWDSARNDIIILLNSIYKKGLEFPQALNHFIREVGLYPYLNIEKASWQEKFVYEAFKVDVGDEKLTLHREQSSLLKRLIEGKDIAVSAPTSFGKSFVIDAYIAIKNPRNVLIIVPTIALTDETRRRIQKKFGHKYKIITTTDISLGDKNIFIFPQERAAYYVGKIKKLDILIIDEFYKASKKYDKERSPSLLRAIIKLSRNADQRYYLAPNIKKMNDSFFTKNMEFISLDFNTVYLKKYDYVKELSKDYTKSDALLDICNAYQGKTLIYAGTYACIKEISSLFSEKLKINKSFLLHSFADWICKNYTQNWQLSGLVRRGCGIHNGKLHRSLSQIQIKLFEESDGLSKIISTSSIIEGVNTSAENVVLWRNKSGSSNLNDFTYKNIIGRGGRMFKYFIGNIFLLENPPKQEEIQLELEFTDELALAVDEQMYQNELTREQIAKIIEKKEEIDELIGHESYLKLEREGIFNDSDASTIINIAKDLKDHSEQWNGLSYLNSDDPAHWESLLYKIARVMPGSVGTTYTKFVNFIVIISNNWHKTMPELLDDLSGIDIGVEEFFELERTVSFKFSSFLNILNSIQKEVFNIKKMDISSFIAKISHVFLPPNVYTLEEYGLPRMISKKIHESGVINLEEKLEIHVILNKFSSIGEATLINKTKCIDPFDKYIIRHFYDGLKRPN